jgi:hypothetical protein
MSSVASIKAGEAFIEILAKDLTKGGLDKASGSLKSFGKSIAAVGASLSAIAGAGLAGFGAALKNFADFGSEINDFSARTGVSTDWAQSLRVGAELGGASMQDLENGIRKMQKTLAKTGQMSGMSPEQQFMAIADQISKIQDPAQRAAKAMEYFGKSGTKLLPMMEKGAKGLQEQFNQMQSMGLILSPEDIKTADELGDAWDMLKMSTSQVVRLIGASLAPTIISLVQGITSAVQAVGQWINEHRGLVKGIAIGLAVLGGLAAIMVALPAIIGVVSVAFAALTSPIGLMVVAIGLLLSLIPGIGSAFDALLSGNFTKAWDIFTAGLYLGFLEVFNGVQLLVIDFIEWLSKQLPDIFGTYDSSIFQGMRDELAAEVLEAQKALDALTKEDKKKKAEVKASFADSSGGAALANFGAKAMGTQSGFAAARISQMGPQFDFADEQKKQTKILEDIRDNTDDMGDNEPEFGE